MLFWIKKISYSEFKKDKCFKITKTKLDQLNYLINKNKDCFKKDKCFKITKTIKVRSKLIRLSKVKLFELEIRGV